MPRWSKTLQALFGRQELDGRHLFNQCIECFRLFAQVGGVGKSSQRLDIEPL
ncbi:hypothetical protein FJY63_09175, partial [Candidatus Sumerlaeota bacterium]|nr:hypothetical protein [Candidatus Sumerlaeota bacterium]